MDQYETPMVEESLPVFQEDVLMALDWKTGVWGSHLDDEFDEEVEPGQLEEEQVTESSHYRRFSPSKKRHKNKTNKPRRGGKR